MKTGRLERAAPSFTGRWFSSGLFCCQTARGSAGRHLTYTRGKNMDVSDLTIRQAREVVAIFGGKLQFPATNLNSFALGKIVIIRTDTAGVWCGKLEQKAGREVILSNARRMWKWWAERGISLSEVAVHGIKQEQSMICEAVPEVWLESIEIIPVTEIARQSIMEAENASAR